MKVLIAYDGSAEAGKALDDLTLAGLPGNAQVQVISVAAPWAYYFGGAYRDTGRFALEVGEAERAFAEQGVENAKTSVDRAKGLLRKRFPRWKVETLVVEGSPSHEIISKAKSWKADLIVMGSHGRTLLGRMLLGSVSQNVLHHAGTSVRITRSSGKRRAGPPKILLAYDGSADSEAAVAAVSARSWPKGTRVRMVAVFDMRIMLENVVASDHKKGAERIRSLRTNWTGRKMDAAAAKLAGEGLKVEQQCVEGDPRREILADAARWKADCIFLGSRGLNAVERFLIGSVTSSVATRAPCTVEIYRNAKPGRK